MSGTTAVPVVVRAEARGWGSGGLPQLAALLNIELRVGKTAMGTSSWRRGHL